MTSRPSKVIKITQPVTDIVKIKIFLQNSCNGKIIPRAGLHLVSHIWGFTFSEDGALGGTSRPLKEIGFRELR